MTSKTAPADGRLRPADRPHRRAIRHLRTQAGGLPMLVAGGIALFVAGLLIDVIGPVLGSGHPSHSPGSAHVGHLVALAGMAAILTAVVINGARLHLRPTTAGTQSKEPSDAIR